MFARILALVAVVLLLPATASAQDNPEFKFDKPPEVKSDVEWSASANAGFLLTTGNSRTITLTGGAKASRKQKRNKFSIEAKGALARSELLVAVDGNDDGAISEDELSRLKQNTAEMWKVNARYDRFLAEKISLYLLANAGADQPAGQEFVGGGQIGYSHTLYKDDHHELIAELGYDLAVENQTADGPDDPFILHSIRAFAGYKAKISEDTGASLSVETLVNANEVDTPAGEVDPAEDTRVLADAELTTSINSMISLSVSVGIRYDNFPALVKAFEIPFAMGFTPRAEELDTTTKVNLIVNFL